MTQATDEHHDALTRRARESLSAGASVGKAFVELAADSGHDPGAVAIAVCVAAGTSRTEAEKRWEGVGERAIAETEGDAETLGWGLEHQGFFDFYRPFDELSAAYPDAIG